MSLLEVVQSKLTRHWAGRNRLCLHAWARNCYQTRYLVIRFAFNCNQSGARTKGQVIGNGCHFETQPLFTSTTNQCLDHYSQVLLTSSTQTLSLTSRPRQWARKHLPFKAIFAFSPFKSIFARSLWLLFVVLLPHRIWLHKWPTADETVCSNLVQFKTRYDNLVLKVVLMWRSTPLWDSSRHIATKGRRHSSRP